MSSVIVAKQGKSNHKCIIADPLLQGQGKEASIRVSQILSKTWKSFIFGKLLVATPHKLLRLSIVTQPDPLPQPPITILPREELGARNFRKLHRQATLITYTDKIHWQDTRTEETDWYMAEHTHGTHKQNTRTEQTDGTHGQNTWTVCMDRIHGQGTRIGYTKRINVQDTRIGYTKDAIVTRGNSRILSFVKHRSPRRRSLSCASTLPAVGVTIPSGSGDISACCALQHSYCHAQKSLIQVQEQFRGPLVATPHKLLRLAIGTQPDPHPMVRFLGRPPDQGWCQSCVVSQCWFRSHQRPSSRRLR